VVLTDLARALELAKLSRQGFRPDRRAPIISGALRGD